MNQAGLNLAASLQVQDVVGEFLQLAVAMVDASGGFFFLKDESTNRFELAEQINLTREQVDPLDDRPFRNKLRLTMKNRTSLRLLAVTICRVASLAASCSSPRWEPSVFSVSSIRKAAMVCNPSRMPTPACCRSWVNRPA